jgi:DNA polymerase
VIGHLLTYFNTIIYGLTDVLTEARKLLAFQRELVGPMRFLTDLPATPESDAASRLTTTFPLPGDTMSSAAQNVAEAPTLDTNQSPYKRVEALIPADSPLHGITSLEELGEWLASNILVPIDETRLNPVLGAGNPTANLMVIGEAPGAEEDKRGEAFVGRAGKLLDDILAAIGFSRTDNVYICNILKSRPPNNRDPRPEEVAAHIPMLYKQIALVQPKILLAVGRQAGNGLLQKNVSLSSLRGVFHDYHGLPLMITYHPAALLRNQQWKRPTWEDVQLLRARYDELADG